MIQQRSSSSLSCIRPLWADRQGSPLFHVVHQAFPLLTMVSPTLQGALKYGFEEAVMVRDMPEPRKFPSLDSCQKKFLWTPGQLILLHPHSLVLWSKQEMRRSSNRHLVSKDWILFFLSQQAGSMFHSHRGGCRWEETTKYYFSKCEPVFWRSTLHLSLRTGRVC